MSSLVQTVSQQSESSLWSFWRVQQFIGSLQGIGCYILIRDRIYICIFILIIFFIRSYKACMCTSFVGLTAEHVIQAIEEMLNAVK